MHWISVKDRLPEEDIPVLIWEDDPYDPFDAGVMWNGDWYYAHRYYDNSDENIPAKPTHWQYVTRPEE